MKIRVKLVLLFSTLFLALMVIFALNIYYSASANRASDYYGSLQREAITKANMLLEAKVPADILQLIYKNADNALYESEVAVYNTDFDLIYHDAVDIDKVKETQAMIDEIREKGKIRFMEGDMQVIGFLYMFEGKEYVITAAAIDEEGFVWMRNLGYTLVFSLFLIFLLSTIAGYYFAGSALKPVGDIVKNVEEITAKDLDHRIPIKSKHDEIGELAITFNNMLDRLETSFQSQRTFVSNISHELRTPLAILVGELDLALQREREPMADQKVLEEGLLDARKLVKLSNDLLDFAKASYDQTEIAKKELRVDELLMEARETVMKANAAYRVDISFDLSMDDDGSFSIRGNEYLLRVAFINLMENACKFSRDSVCRVFIVPQGGGLSIHFKDEGLGIPEQDLPHIFEEFYRGSNKHYVWGSGIGLPLTKKIVSIHQGEILVSSTQGEGSVFTLRLPAGNGGA